MHQETRHQIDQEIRDEATKAERERVLTLIEEELQGWREVAGMGNTFAVESTLVRLRKQVRDGKEED